MTTKIEWVKNPDGSQGKTWNPITGCSPVSEGCRNCYARRMSKRLAGRFGYPADDPFRVTFHPDKLEDPLRWRKPQTVFTCSMGDLFHEDVPDEWIDQVFAVMALCSQHTFQVLTKRPKRMAEYLDQFPVAHLADTDERSFGGYRWEMGEKFPGWPLPNLWLGTSVEDQSAADERIPSLLCCPAARRFVSVEPMLGPVDFDGLWGYSGSATSEQIDNWSIHSLRHFTRQARAVNALF